MQLPSRMGKCTSIKNWLGCLGWALTLWRQRLETTGKHVLLGQYNVLNNVLNYCQHVKIGRILFFNKSVFSYKNGN